MTCCMNQEEEGLLLSNLLLRICVISLVASCLPGRIAHAVAIFRLQLGMFWAYCQLMHLHREKVM